MLPIGYLFEKKLSPKGMKYVKDQTFQRELARKDYKDLTGKDYRAHLLRKDIKKARIMDKNAELTKDTFTKGNEALRKQTPSTVKKIQFKKPKDISGGTGKVGILSKLKGLVKPPEPAYAPA